MNIIIIFTLLPWLLYFSVRTIDALKGIKNQKLNGKWLKKNWQNIFHVEELLLIAIFVYFSKRGNGDLNKIVNEMLFIVMNLYLFINSFYDKRSNKEKKLNKKDIPVLVMTFFLLIIPIIYYFNTKDIVQTYYFLYGYAFFSYPIVLIDYLLYLLIIKLKEKRK